MGLCWEREASLAGTLSLREEYHSNTTNRLMGLNYISAQMRYSAMCLRVLKAYTILALVGCKKVEKHKVYKFALERAKPKKAFETSPPTIRSFSRNQATHLSTHTSHEQYHTVTRMATMSSQPNTSSPPAGTSPVPTGRPIPLSASQEAQVYVLSILLIPPTTQSLQAPH